MEKTITYLLGQDSSTTPVKELIIYRISYTSDADLAEQFSTYFSEVTTKPESQLPPSNFSPLSLMPSLNSSSFYLFPTTEPECVKV